MNKKINIVIIFLLLFVLGHTGLAFGQQSPYAPLRSTELRAPDFSLTDLNGKTFRLSSKRGKPVLLFFGTTWCPACRQQFPLCKEIYNKYSSRGLEFVYINIMEPRGKVARFVRANALPFRILLDDNADVANNYEVIGVPTFILINRDGKIFKKSHSITDLPLQQIFAAK